jgi:very-short-patch-repair endonuclease
MARPKKFFADQCIAAIAEPQHGVVARHQALAAGLSDREIDHRVASGKLVRIFPCVYSLAGVAATPLTRLSAACLWAKGVGSHRTAACMLGLPGARTEPIEISTNQATTHPRLIVHRRAPLPECDLTVVDGIAITAAHRTLLDLGAVVREAIVEMALDAALKKGLVSYAQLRWHLAMAGKRGVRGAAKLRRILNARAVNKGRRDSPLETLAGRLFRNSPLPWPVLQYQVWDRSIHLGRVDFAYPDLKLGIEVLGWDPHSGKVSWEKDLRRRTYLQSHGWLILEFTWNDITKRRDYVIETILRAIRTRSFPNQLHVM